MSRSRIWLFRGLVIMASGLMLLSWFLPWWSCDTVGQLTRENAVTIYPYGLRHSLEFYASYISGAEMPVWFTPLMWLYLGLAIVALLIGAWIKDKSIGLFGRKLNLSRLIIGVAGFSYIVVVILAVIIAAIRTGDFFGMHLIGHSRLSVEPLQDAEANLQFGYWLASGVGLLCIALALLRDKIIGKAKLISR